MEGKGEVGGKGRTSGGRRCDEVWQAGGVLKVKYGRPLLVWVSCAPEPH